MIWKEGRVKFVCETVKRIEAMNNNYKLSISSGFKWDVCKMKTLEKVKKVAGINWVLDRLKISQNESLRPDMRGMMQAAKIPAVLRFPRSQQILL